VQRRARACAWLAGGALSLVGFERRQAPQVGPRANLVVSMLDVGQGDATLLEFPSGEAMLVDGGGFMGSGVDTGQRVLLPVLRDRRRTRLAVVALSHPHPDHFTGLLTLAKSVVIGEFWDTGQGEALGAGPVYRELLQTLRQNGTKIRRPRELCGAPRRFGEVAVHVLAPCPAFVRDRSANDNSFVLRVNFEDRSFLLTGDAEGAQERSLRDQALFADVLKVGHHGSRTSTSPDFVDRVRPTFATISSGLRNGFGHPHPETLRTLSEAGVRLLRLDRMGGVRFTTDGRTLDVHAFSPAY
jgi:competence protein ComEC